MIDYSKRLVEVDEILNYLSKEDYNRIPEQIKKIIRENKSKEYIWKYDENKKLKEQNVSSDTIAILSYLNTEYLLNEEQQAFVKSLHMKNNENYNISYNDFKFPNNNTSKSNYIVKQNEIIEYKKPKCYKKITQMLQKYYFFITHKTNK